MTEVQTAPITSATLDKSLSYEEYRTLIDWLLKEDKTTGENHSEAMVHYTKMNVHRMKRLDRRTELTEDLKIKLKEIDRKMIWLVLTEAWCGDAAQLIPVIQKMADESDKINTRYILRDQNLEIMDQFLTNGHSRSIPKLICLDEETLEILGSWGPRPETTQYFYQSQKNDPEISGKKAAENLHKWYADDRTQSIQNEFLDILDDWHTVL